MNVSGFSKNPVLKEFFERRKAIDQQGNECDVHSEIHPHYAAALHRTVLKEKPKSVLEIGMAFGGSTLIILDALEQLNQGGRLISIDPEQMKTWKNAGLASVQRAKLDHAHELMEMPDYFALPKLLEKGKGTFDFAYIDGWHTFDSVLLDFFYVDKLVKPGAVVVFNDCGMPAVHKVIGFLQRHRKYEEIDVGLEPELVAQPFRQRLGERLCGIRRPDRQMSQDRYFRKLERWNPSWDFYAPF